MARCLLIFLFVSGMQSHGFAQSAEDYKEKYQELVIQTQNMQEMSSQFFSALTYAMGEEGIFESDVLEKQISKSLLIEAITDTHSNLSKSEQRKLIKQAQKKSLAGLYGSEKKAKKFYQLMQNNFQEMESLNRDLGAIYSDLSKVSLATQSLLLENLAEGSVLVLDRLNEFLEKIDPRLIEILNQHVKLKFPEGIQEIEKMQISEEKLEGKELRGLQRSIKIRRSLFLSLALVDLVGITSAFFVGDAVIYTSMLFAFKNMAYIVAAWYLVFESRAQFKLYKVKQKIDPRVFQLNEVLEKMNQRFKSMDQNLKRISCVKSGAA
ncbi:MAG: hypothetical protein CL674_09810 [Bdellovibrionaceae bacterium]|nr:hypothetical protein [Pseudobdellovibrionaceae bacterium]